MPTKQYNDVDRYEKEVEQLESMSEEEIRVVQFQKLKKQIKYCYDASPFFYQKKFDALGVKPEDIKTWEDFRNLPLYISKEDEKEAQEESLERYGHSFGTNLCAPIENVVQVGSTTGTTGEPTFTYMYTQRDYERNHQMVARQFWMMGIRPGERVVYAAGVANLSGLRIYEHSFRYYGCLPIPVGAEAGTERILRIIDATKPTTLMATGPLIEYLIEAAPKILKKEVSDFKLKRVISSGAPAAGIPTTKKKIEDAYQCRLFDAFGGCLACSCDVDDYQGMHVLARDFFILFEDMIDPNTREPIWDIRDGTIGDCRMTSLEYEARPFFKSSQGDIYQVFTGRCKCGSNIPRVRILGRSDDMLIIKGANVYPAAIKNVVSSFEPRTTGEMRVVLDQPGPAVPPPMKLKVEHGPDITTKDQKKTLARELEDAMHNRLKFRAAIELIPSGTLERAAGPGAKGKMIEKTYEK